MKRTNGNRFGLVPHTAGEAGNERKDNIKRAWFFITVAVLFVLADQLGRVKNTSHLSSDLASVESVSLTVSPRDEPGDRPGLSVRFRLSNRGNHSVFYPMGAGTNLPLGQIVARSLPSSEWISLTAPSEEPASADPGYMETILTWIEMPPGGWVDGEFHDPGEPPGEHAYVIYVKPARDARRIRIVSNSYHSLAN